MAMKKLRSCCEWIYLMAVCAFLLWDIPYMTEAQWTFDVRPWFPDAWCGLAVAAMVLSRLKLGTVWLPAFLVTWISVVSIVRGVEVEQAGAVAHGMLAFLVILPASRAVRFDRLTKALRGLLAVWTAFLTAQAAVGLWAVLTGHAVFSLKGTWYIGVNLGDNRLYLNAYVTTGAVKMGLSVLLAVLGAAMARKRAGRALYLLCAAVQLACLSLTDCRTAFIAVGAGLGLMVMALVLRGGKRNTRRRVRRICAVLAVPVLMVGMYAALSGTLNVLAPHAERELDNITMLELPAHLLPSAAAEGAVQHRELEAGNLFNDRQIIWDASLRLLREEPRFLLTGTTMALSPMLTNRFIAPEAAGVRPFVHVHNIYLQTLVAWGIPGFALLVAFLVLFLLAAWRVMMKHDLPLWQRLLPVPTLYVMLCETVDCFTRLSEGSPLLLFGCLFAGMTLAADERERRPVCEARAAVDVIIPVYNAAKYVVRAAKSALVCPTARVILVDDGSTDGSGNICDALAANDDRVAVLHQENRGASAARNAGLDAATAEYVAFLDADDVLLPGALELLMDKQADAAYGQVARREIQPDVQAARRVQAAREALLTALNDPTAYLHTHGWLFRRALLTERFDERLSLGEDGEWLLRTLLRLERVHRVHTPVYRYCIHAQSAVRAGQNVCRRYLQTLETATSALKEAQAPAEAAMYRLTHLLLMLTHGNMEEALLLRDAPPFDEAFRTAKLPGFAPRILTLRLLRWRAYRLVRAAVRLRRWMNGRACRRAEKHASEE